MVIAPSTPCDWNASCKLLALRLNADFEAVMKEYRPDLADPAYDGMDIFLSTPTGSPPIDRRKDYASRICLDLGNGVVAKSPKPQGNIGDRYYGFSSFCNSHAAFEEHNARIIEEKLGIKDILVPAHKCIGVAVSRSGIVVNPQGFGWTLCQDMSEQGQYTVTDVQPWYFAMLANKESYLAAYKRHLDAIVALYHSPDYIVSVNRHSIPNDPYPCLSRMILSRQRDNIGELFIGDLDNLIFEEKR